MRFTFFVGVINTTTFFVFLDHLTVDISYLNFLIFFGGDIFACSFVCFLSRVRYLSANFDTPHPRISRIFTDLSRTLHITQ